MGLDTYFTRVSKQGKRIRTIASPASWNHGFALVDYFARLYNLDDWGELYNEHTLGRDIITKFKEDCLQVQSDIGKIKEVFPEFIRQGERVVDVDNDVAMAEHYRITCQHFADICDKVLAEWDEIELTQSGDKVVIHIF